jgi:hypothetical protein
MALALVAIHDEQPDMAVEYAELARDNLRDHHSHETVLVRYYLALAYLTAGKAALARLEWAARAPLEPSIENGVEVAWLLRAIAAWQEQVQRANLAQDAETLDLARLMQEQLAEDANEQQQKSDERGRR